jgi:hypothetical protein
MQRLHAESQREGLPAQDYDERWKQARLAVFTTGKDGIAVSGPVTHPPRLAATSAVP